MYCRSRPICIFSGRQVVQVPLTKEDAVDRIDVYGLKLLDQHLNDVVCVKRFSQCHDSPTCTSGYGGCPSVGKVKT